jgi:6-phosphogluconate dehydrogenase
MKKTIGYVGLGKMGKGMTENLLEKGWNVVAYNASPAPIRELEEKGAMPAYSLGEMTGKLTSPRLVWLMIPHTAVDKVLAELVPFLEKGDAVVDGGNSFYKESMRRAKELTELGIHFMDAGTSGGPRGARLGTCTMVGGEKSTFDAYEELFRDISVPDGYAYMGTAGAGHFVKMVHNGIEYGMMQAIGEGFEVLKKSRFSLDLVRVADLYNHKSVIESRLVGWAKNAFQTYGTDLKNISGNVSHSGEGLWTVATAKELGVPVPIIEGSLRFREESQKNSSYTGQVVSALRNQFGGHEVKREEEKHEV